MVRWTTVAGNLREVVCNDDGAIASKDDAMVSANATIMLIAPSSPNRSCNAACIDFAHAI